MVNKSHSSIRKTVINIYKKFTNIFTYLVQINVIKKKFLLNFFSKHSIQLLSMIHSLVY